MYQSHVYLEVRILTSSTKVFPINSDMISSVYAVTDALNCSKIKDLKIEHLTNALNVPSSYGFNGFSVRVAEKGSFLISFHNRTKNIKIEDVRIEEDAGRLTHSMGKTRMDYTYVGCPSLRIKTSPDFELGEEAELFLQNLGRLVQYLGISRGIPVETAIRCNAYVGISEYPRLPDYYVKLRNLNSFNFVRKAINSELSRQEEILSSGGKVSSESRLWNEKQNFTQLFKARNIQEVRQFEKVSENTSSFFDFDISDFMAKAWNEGGENLLSQKNSIELPEARRERFCRDYGLSRLRAENICDEKDRSDFFEEAVKYGTDARDIAHWIMSELLRLLKRNSIPIKNDNLTPKRFARIIQLFRENKIHSGIAKQLLQEVLETGAEPDDIIQKKEWKQIGLEEELTPIVNEVLKANPAECEKLRSGDMAPLEFLTGLVMKKTQGLAVPQIVKDLIKKNLDIRIVYVLSCGGAICGTIDKNGGIQIEGEKVLCSMIDQTPLEDERVRYQVIPVGQVLSEEIEPSDWALLISEVAAKINSGNATGIIITHGKDTLPYTAALLFWLFSDAGVPIVFVASSSTPDQSNESRESFKLASSIACQKENGVYVVYDGKVFSPLNLKFEHGGMEGFSNWNITEPVFESSGPISSAFSGNFDFDRFITSRILKNASDSLMMCKLFPGLKPERFVPMFENGIKNFILELYDTGTGSMRPGDYSLKPLLLKGRKAGCRFYCTSQQKACLDFTTCSTSRRVWREGAIPMGRLTTESVIGLIYAATLASDNDYEFDQLMETYAKLYS